MIQVVKAKRKPLIISWLLCVSTQIHSPSLVTGFLSIRIIYHFCCGIFQSVLRLPSSGKVQCCYLCSARGRNRCVAEMRQLKMAWAWMGHQNITENHWHIRCTVCVALHAQKQEQYVFKTPRCAPHLAHNNDWHWISSWLMLFLTLTDLLRTSLLEPKILKYYCAIWDCTFLLLPSVDNVIMLCNRYFK